MALISGFNKRGNIGIEVLLVIIILFASTIGIIFLYDIFTDIKDDIVADEDYSDDAEAYVTKTHNIFPKVFDGGIMLAFVLLYIGGIIAAFVIDSHPLFFVIVIVLMVSIFVVVALLGNAYEDVFSDDSVSSLPDNFPMAHFIMTHLLEIAVFMAASIGIALYGKSRRDSI